MVFDSPDPSRDPHVVIAVMNFLICWPRDKPPGCGDNIDEKTVSIVLRALLALLPTLGWFSSAYS